MDFLTAQHSGTALELAITTKYDCRVYGGGEIRSPKDCVA
jgi:hypothetical protein